MVGAQVRVVIIVAHDALVALRLMLVSSPMPRRRGRSDVWAREITRTALAYPE